MHTITEKMAQYRQQMKMKKMRDKNPDLSWLKTRFETRNGKLYKIIDSCRYSNEEIKTYGPDMVMGWIEDDHARLESYGEKWHMVGIVATLTISLPVDGQLVEHTFESAGLWGIESDSGDEYFDQVFSDECDQLINDLHNEPEIFNVGEVVSIDTENTGGNVIVDVVTLENGQVLIVGTDFVTLFPSLGAWENSDHDSVIGEIARY